MEAPIEDFVAWLETLIEADILMREVSENAWNSLKMWRIFWGDEPTLRKKFNANAKLCPFYVFDKYSRQRKLFYHRYWQDAFEIILIFAYCLKGSTDLERDVALLNLIWYDIRTI
jgi:hypothetical protein